MPGVLNTPLLHEVVREHTEKAAKRLVYIPWGRFYKREEIARATLFLASDDASFLKRKSPFLVHAASRLPTSPLEWRCRWPQGRVGTCEARTD